MGGHLYVVLLKRKVGGWTLPVTAQPAVDYTQAQDLVRALSAGDEIQMSVIALFTWMVTILAGLILLIIWIIEYDAEFQTAAATRLPVPVISAHALLGLGGLMLWISYLLLGEERLAWATVVAFGAVAFLGLIMAARWFRVYRAYDAPVRRIPGAAQPLRNGASRCRSLSPTASWPSPPSSWCCSPRLA